MATNLAIDDNLIIEAKRLGHHKTKKEAVNQALKSYIRYKKQLNILDFFGKIEIDPTYNYKKYRA